MKNTCDNLFAPSRDNPDIDDLVVLWTRKDMGIRAAHAPWQRAVNNFLVNHGWTAFVWVLGNIERLSNERYDRDPLFGRWDCEVKHECYCAYNRAGLSPLEHTLIKGGKFFLNPWTGEEFDREGNLVAVRALG